jgi:signal peptidase I
VSRAAIATSLAAAGLAALGLTLARRRCTVVTVRGHSMNPTLADGQRVLAVRRPRYRTGDIVVFRVSGAAGTRGDPHHRVKRVIATGGAARPAVFDGSALAAAVPAGHLAVAGDNAAQSQDSRQLGYIPLGDVLGRVRLRPR